MRVKQSEIHTNGPWRMRTGHANRMRWIPGRCAVAHVKARKTRECENAKCEICENAKPARLYVCAKCELWNCEMCEMCEVHEKHKMLITQKHENVQDMRVRKMQTLWDPKMHVICEMCENVRYLKCEIAKVAMLQQVQYKVLQYGLYTPIET
jgi:hypothetical protein